MALHPTSPSLQDTGILDAAMLAESRSSSPLSQVQNSRPTSPDPPKWHRSSGESPGFILPDKQSFASTALADSTYRWKYIPSFGVVHSMGCDICTQFINHMIDAECSQDFQVAVMERDNHHDRHFCDGMSEGRRKQKQDFQDEVQFLRAASRHTEAALACSLEKNLALGKEIEALKLRLQTPAQTTGVTPPGHSSTSIGFESSSSTECQPACSSLSSSAAVSFKVVSTSAAFTPTQHPGYQHTGQQQHTASVTLRTSHALPPRPSGPLPQSPSTTPHAAIAQASSLSGQNHFPKTLQDLEWLMKAAHRPGNNMYLTKVRALCAEAHATPRENKTELQEVLLSKWRNPVALGSSPKPDVKINPRIDDPVEMWYSYLCTHQKSWPRGVRKDSLGRPVMSDLRASRMISRLRSEAGLKSSSPNSPVPRATFIQHIVDLFSRPGTYQQILVRDDINVAQTLSYLPFRGRTGSLAIETLVRHCAACGITVEMATQDFEPWARNYCLEPASLSPQPNPSPL
jgi:hypothetical protein